MEEAGLAVRGGGAQREESRAHRDVGRLSETPHQHVHVCGALRRCRRVVHLQTTQRWPLIEIVHMGVCSGGGGGRVGSTGTSVGFHSTQVVISGVLGNYQIADRAGRTLLQGNLT